MVYCLLFSSFFPIQPTRAQYGYQSLYFFSQSSPLEFIFSFSNPTHQSSLQPSKLISSFLFQSSPLELTSFFFHITRAHYSLLELTSFYSFFQPTRASQSPLELKSLLLLCPTILQIWNIQVSSSCNTTLQYSPTSKWVFPPFLSYIYLFHILFFP